MRMFHQDTERVTNGLKEAITLLCKTGLNYQSELSIDGLLGITLDHNEVFLVSIKEIIKNPRDFHVSSSIKSLPDSSPFVLSGDTRKRKGSDSFFNDDSRVSSRASEEESIADYDEPLYNQSRFSRSFKAPKWERNTASTEPLSLVSRPESSENRPRQLSKPTQNQEEPLSLTKIDSGKNITDKSRRDNAGESVHNIFNYEEREEKSHTSSSKHNHTNYEASATQHEIDNRDSKVKTDEGDIKAQCDTVKVGDNISPNACDADSSKQLTHGSKNPSGKLGSIINRTIENVLHKPDNAAAETDTRPSSGTSSISYDADINAAVSNEQTMPTDLSKPSNHGHNMLIKNEPPDTFENQTPPSQKPASSSRRKRKGKDVCHSSAAFLNVYESGTSSTAEPPKPAQQQPSATSTTTRPSEDAAALMSSSLSLIDPDSHSKWLQSIAAYVHGADGSLMMGATPAQAQTGALALGAPLPAHLHSTAANLSSTIKVC